MKHLTLLYNEHIIWDLKARKLSPALTCNNVGVRDPEARECCLWFGPGNGERGLCYIAENHLRGWLRTW